MTRIATAASLALSAALVTSSAPPAAAATEQVLYSFKNACCGYPYGRLHFMNGHLFGTGFGGQNYDGQVFELTNSGGTWTEAQPLKFDGTDGAGPLAGLISDASGFLYGTTGFGDANSYGNVFILDKLGGSWHHATVWAFPETSGDGQVPVGDLVMDSSGNIYGTTQLGGAYGNNGIAFELSPSFGFWSETILHSFGSGSDASDILSGLLMDSTGALFGASASGGKYGNGTVYELTQSGGVWSEKVLFSFAGGSDGNGPEGDLIRDSKGALYGTTYYGGKGDCNGYGCGTVFKLSLSGGVWKENQLYAFSNDSHGGLPVGGLRWSGSGTLYGTTTTGGVYQKGTVFELTLSGGVWSETVLHSFGNGTDGANPYCQVILDKSGNLYGTAGTGGKYGYGTVWEVTP